MALFSFFVLGERFSRRQLAGLLLAGSCIFLLGFDTFCALPGADGRQGLGNLLVLAAVASEAVFLLFGKKLQVPLPGLAMTALLSLLGAAFCLPPALYEARDFDFAALTGEDMAAMLYFGAVYTDVAYLFWFRGAARTTGAEASTFTVLMPLSASLLSTCLLGESISGLQATALLLAVGSILLLTVGSKGQAEIADERGDCPEAK
jgi:drug/metabolite transporter (DMT)-like permease